MSPGIDEQQHKEKMMGVNPEYILRNYMAWIAARLGKYHQCELFIIDNNITYVLRSEALVKAGSFFLNCFFFNTIFL